jgi:formate dehydrogenase accessory protein FdhE
VSPTLDALTREHPELMVAAAALRALATTLPEPTLPTGVPHREAAEARLAGGIPALEGEPLLSGAALLSNVRVLAAALESGAPLHLSSVVESLRASTNEAEADDLAVAAQREGWDSVRLVAERARLDPDAVITLVDHAARPALRAGARAIHQLLAPSRWSRGTCPACGAAPLLGEIRGGGALGSAERERILRCGRCTTAWPLPRLRCVSCGETNHRQLAYLHGHGEESFRRAEICSSCNSYLKTIAVLAPLDLTELLSADLATAALDIAAVERGFHR